jgi:hypothetical protein
MTPVATRSKRKKAHKARSHRTSLVAEPTPRYAHYVELGQVHSYRLS